MPPSQTGVYVHLPFCRSRCGYCDFAVVTDKDDAQERYARALLSETTYWASRLWEPLVSLYFGGGTPSQFRPDLLQTVMDQLRSKFPWAEDVERTCEANPESLDENVLGVWRDLGISRVSLGVQSFEPSYLSLLDRRHDRPMAETAIKRLADHGFQNWSLDLMYGLPGQTLDQWKRDLDTALTFDPPHVSFYHLILHPNLPTTQKGLERMPPDADDLFAEMFLHAVETLENSGRAVYELSNAARPGYECRHNLLYWTGGNWVGMGLSAAGYLNGRYINQPSSWGQYLSLWECESPDPLDSVLPPSPEDRSLDLVMLNLRLREGISRALLETLFPPPHSEAFEHLVEDLHKGGFLREVQGRLTLSPRGWLVHSEITTRLLGALASS